jgi:hypothetical protein
MLISSRRRYVTIAVACTAVGLLILTSFCPTANAHIKKAKKASRPICTLLVVTTSAADAQAAELLLGADKPESVIAQQPRLHVAGENGFAVNVDSLNAQDRSKVRQALLALKVGGCCIVPVHGAYLIFKVVPPTSKDHITQISR